MNHLRANTSGLDCEINQFQIDLYSGLSNAYSFDIQGYSRVYKNPNKEGATTPEVWDETQQQYREMYLDDSNALSFYFIDGDSHKTEDGSYFTAPLKVVFIVNLSKIETVGRADAEAQKVAVSSIQKDVMNSFKIEGIEKGLSNVFSGFNIDQITFDDMQPWHVFAVNGTIGYYLNKNCQ